MSEPDSNSSTTAGGLFGQQDKKGPWHTMGLCKIRRFFLNIIIPDCPYRKLFYFSGLIKALLRFIGFARRLQGIFFIIKNFYSLVHLPTLFQYFVEAL
jgi:hypothetical protein